MSKKNLANVRLLCCSLCLMTHAASSLLWSWTVLKVVIKDFSRLGRDVSFSLDATHSPARPELSDILKVIYYVLFNHMRFISCSLSHGPYCVWYTYSHDLRCSYNAVFYQATLFLLLFVTGLTPYSKTCWLVIPHFFISLCYKYLGFVRYVFKSAIQWTRKHPLKPRSVFFVSFENVVRRSKSVYDYRPQSNSVPCQVWPRWRLTFPKWRPVTGDPLGKVLKILRVLHRLDLTRQWFVMEQRKKTYKRVWKQQTSTRFPPLVYNRTLSPPFFFLWRNLILHDGNAFCFLPRKGNSEIA